jgi:DNA invertase Pin-like site-specific DNA recombinase
MQESDLREWASRRGWPVVAVYRDQRSGTKMDGQGLRSCLEAATRREYDVLAVWKLDRLGRSVVGVLHALQALQAAEVGLYAHGEALDTSSPTGKALAAFLAIVAELEAGFTRERVRAGMDAAKRRGVRFGQPRKVQNQEAADAVRLHGSMTAAARALGVDKGTISRACKRHRQEAQP